MLKKFTLFTLCLAAALSAFAQKIPTPAEYLGRPLGSQFTYHYQIAGYFNAVAAASKNVKLVSYGTTNEGRPLIAAFIASDENIGRLEDIRQHNMALTGLGKESAALANAPAVVWLSYNVHGNEPSSSEAAMQTLYDLVNPNNAQARRWLQNTVVVIDPCLNPDGRDRYVNFYNQAKGIMPDANPSAREHAEPWPGGRSNHYMFDLNRDWAWQTQKEVQTRVALFNQWLPQVHVDFHEQGYNSPYYFAPAAEPMHRDITRWQRDFQVTIGKNNAKYFDQNGWLYFTKEEFDLLYPSYGDTYPLYNGAIGMTYEQGGIGAGLAVITRSGDTLTLADRIAHHHSNGLSTVEAASANATKLLAEYQKYFTDARNQPPGAYKAYVVKNTNADNIKALTQLLDKNRIQYSFWGNQNASGFNYFTAKEEKVNITPSDLIINAAQPKAVLLNVLMEPKTLITDSNTYDITAWALPYVYGLKTYGLKQAVQANGHMPAAPAPTVAINAHAYAYVANWQSVQDARFLAALLQKGIKVRYAETPFNAAGKQFNAGSLIITRAGNNENNFDQIINETATAFNRQLVPLTTGFVEKGADLGSRFVHYINAPKVMMLTGEGTSASDAGEVWQFFEQQLGYPVTQVKVQDVSRTKLSSFDVIIMPDGYYNNISTDKLRDWVRDGGKLIAMGGAVSTLSGQNGFNIKTKEAAKDSKKPSAPAVYGDRERESIKSGVPGAIYKVKLDNTHPLGYGYPNYYYTLKLSDDIYDYLGDNGWDVGTVGKTAYVSGFVGQKAKAKIADGTLLGVQSAGRGSVVYIVDDPLFRSFWEGGKLLFSNAVFMVGN
ncbi:M14 family metallopeptidase [Mucilaginibacter koreensis]